MMVDPNRNVFPVLSRSLRLWLRLQVLRWERFPLRSEVQQHGDVLLRQHEQQRSLLSRSRCSEGLHQETNVSLRPFCLLQTQNLLSNKAPFSSSIFGMNLSLCFCLQWVLLQPGQPGTGLFSAEEDGPRGLPAHWAHCQLPQSAGPHHQHRPHCGSKHILFLQWRGILDFTFFLSLSQNITRVSKTTKMSAHIFVHAKKTDFLSRQALKDSKEVEVIDLKIRRKEDPLKWPLPGLTVPNQTHTDFSQLINCPEFIPRQMTEESKGKCSWLSFLNKFENIPQLKVLWTNNISDYNSFYLLQALPGPPAQ